MADTLGSDWNMTLNDEGEFDLDPSGAVVEGPMCVAQTVLRGWETPQGSMPWAPDEGFYLADWLNADLDEADVLAIGSGLEADALLDERVESISVTPTFDAAASRLSISAEGQTAEGPFKLVLESSDLDVSILAVTA